MAQATFLTLVNDVLKRLREPVCSATCLLYTSPSPRDLASDLVCRLLLEKKNFFNDTATTEIYTTSQSSAASDVYKRQSHHSHFNLRIIGSEEPLIPLSCYLSLIHISEPTRPRFGSRMPSSA